jgi:hypothetical protein
MMSAGEEDAFKNDFEGYVEATELSDTQIAGTALAPDFVPSESQKSAASLILHAYRRFVIRRRGVSLSGLLAELDRHFSLCLEEAQHIKWPSKHTYRKVYLGALPHMLLCLGEAHKCAMSAKNEAKERFKVAQHLELDEIGKRQTALS